MSGEQPPSDDPEEGESDQQPAHDQSTGGSQRQPRQGASEQPDEQPDPAQRDQRPGTARRDQQPGTAQRDQQPGATQRDQQPGTARTGGTGGTRQPSTGGAATRGGGAAPTAGAGESVGELLGRESVRNRMKFVVGAYALLSLGIGFAGFIAIDQVTGAISGLPAQVAGADLAMGGVMGLVLLGPVLAVLFGARLDEQLHVGHQGVLAASFVSNAAGHFVLLLIGSILVLEGAGGGYDLFGTFLAPYLIGAVLTGVIGAAGVWLRDWAL